MTGETPPAAKGVTEAMVKQALGELDALEQYGNATSRYIRPLLAALSLPAPGEGDATKDSLHSCVCLLEVMADNAKERGDDAEWAMMSVMAKNGREVLDGYHPE